MQGGTGYRGYLADLMRKKGVGEQFINKADVAAPCCKDPLCETKYSPVKGLIHRYPDRVVVTITNRCFVYCSFCFRKRNWTAFEGFNLNEAVEYVSSHNGIREVIVSGGDPLVLSDGELVEILTGFAAVEHISFLRLGTRAPTLNPFRITDGFAELLGSFRKKVWIAIHVNHINEITSGFEGAINRLISCGVPVVSQTVLLKGINDTVEVLEPLFCRLVSLGIKPYYLFNCDLADGNEQYRVRLEEAMKIMEQLRGRISGLCVPAFAFDLEGGGGKIVVEPDRMIGKEGKKYRFRNFEGKIYGYTDF